MTQTNNEREELLDKLLAEYWDIAYSEGNSGLWHGKKAQSTLNDIRKLFKTQSPISQNEHQEAVALFEEVKVTREDWMAYNEWCALSKLTRPACPISDAQIVKIKQANAITSPPKQIPDGWRPSEKEILKYASEEELFLFADESDLLEIANGILELVQIKINASTMSLTSETNTEVGDD